MNLLQFLIYSESIGIYELFSDGRQLYLSEAVDFADQPLAWSSAAEALMPRLLRVLRRLPKEEVAWAKNKKSKYI